MGRLFIIVVLAALSLTLYAEPEVCLRMLVKTGEGANANRNFWRKKELKIGRGANAPPIVFGFDAELWHVSDLLALVYSHPEALAEAKNMLRHEDSPRYTKQQLTRWLGVGTEAEVDPHLRASSRNKTEFTLLDLKRTSLKGLKHGPNEKSEYADLLQESIQVALDKRNFKIVADLEGSSGSDDQGLLGSGSAIELKMDEAIPSPREFSKLIKGFLHKELEWPETHFHVSVPAEKVTPQQIMLAARALEMKIVLEEAIAELDYDGNLHPYDQSVLAQSTSAPHGFPYAERGVVRIEGDRWDDPFVAHDIEIRMWQDADQALNSMRFFITLLQGRNRLRDTEAFIGTYQPKMMPANLHNSLRYAAFVLKDRLPPEKQSILQGMNALADRITNAASVTPEFRKEIAQYLKDNNVLSYLSADTFMTPVPTRRRAAGTP